MTNESELSEREREIICLVATGASNKEIAQRLFISTNTVKVHLRNIFAKIGVTSRTEATLFAIREGLVPTPGNLPPQAAVEGEIKGSPVVENGTGVRPPQRRARMIALLSVAALVFLAMVGVTVRQLVTPPQTPAAQTPVPRWQERAPLPAPRSGLAAAVYAGQIYAIGGEDEKQVSGDTYSYIPQDNRWTILSKKPTAVADISAAVIGGKIYVPGGRLDSGDLTDVLEVYDPALDSWIQGAPLPVKVSAYALAMLEGKLYLFGGWDGSKYTAFVYSYSPDNDRWSKVADMPTARGFAGAAVINSRIFIVGGTDGNQVLDENDEFSPGQKNPWVSRARLPEGRSAMGVTSLADTIYLVGGRTGSEELSEVAIGVKPLEFLPSSNLWVAFDPLIDAPRLNLAIVPVDRLIYVIGGRDQSGVSNKNLSYQAIYTIAIPALTK